MMEQKELVASIFKTFNVDLSSLKSRIAFQKTVYILQEIGFEKNFNFVWNHFGPYSSSLAMIGRSINEVDVMNASELNDEYTNKFKELVEGYRRDTKFLEMMADVIFIVRNMGIKNKEEIFSKIIEHRSYLDDREMFNLINSRLFRLNLI